jgi:hypothetical protein
LERDEVDIVNCLDCGKLMITRFTKELCPDCDLIQKEKAYIIKAFMYNNPRATKMDVFMETGISLRIIDRVSHT